MDLNYLLHRQQVERSRADGASCDEARRAHAELAALYERAIETLTRGNLRFLGTPDRTRKQNWSNELRRLAESYSGSEIRTAGARPRRDPVPN
jgi:hypothetical protein